MSDGQRCSSERVAVGERRAWSGIWSMLMKLGVLRRLSRQCWLSMMDDDRREEEGALGAVLMFPMLTGINS